MKRLIPIPPQIAQESYRQNQIGQTVFTQPRPKPDLCAMYRAVGAAAVPNRSSALTSLHRAATAEGSSARRSPGGKPVADWQRPHQAFTVREMSGTSIVKIRPVGS